jgi:hypothetical protein
MTNSTAAAQHPSPGGTGQVVVDGALPLPRSFTAVRALVTGEGVEACRRTYPRPPRSMTTSPTRAATHAVVGLVLGLLTLLVVAGFVVSLARSPLLLAPAGALTLLSLAALGALHRSMTRRLMDMS